MLGKGDDPTNNLYWGAMYGVKTFFKNSGDWQLFESIKSPSDSLIVERCVFRHNNHKAYLIADAYKGEKIRNALTDFLKAASGEDAETLMVREDSLTVRIPMGGAADLGLCRS